MSTRRQHTAALCAGPHYALIAGQTVPVSLVGRATEVYRCTPADRDVAEPLLSMLLEEHGHATQETRAEAARAPRRV